MIASASFLGLVAISASFFPHEILGYFGAPAHEVAVVAVQVAGALYAGFAILNWMARGNAIGGVYSRPVALGNFLHFGMVALVLFKQVFDASPPSVFVVGTTVNALFAGCFGYLLFARGGSPA